MSVHLRGVKPALSPDSEALTKTPPAPQHLDAHARKEWQRVVPELVARRILVRADLAGVENYCTMIGIVRLIEAQRADTGGMIDPKTFGVMHRAMQTARQLASEYGLTPTSRSRLGTAVSEDDDNPLAV